MLIATIKQGVTDLWGESIGSSKMSRLIAAAVREYSRWNPRIIEVDLETAADQQWYEAPENCIGIWKLLWYPMGQTYSELKASSEVLFLLRRPSRYHMPSQRVIDDINQGAHIEAMSGHWRYFPVENKFYLDPEPGSGTTDIELTYWAAHVLNGGATGYDTIPDQDLEIMRDLVLAEILQGKRAEYSIEPDYGEGLEREAFHYLPANIGATIADLRAKVRQKYGGPLVVVAP